MNGEYLTMAQACGEEPVRTMTFIPGTDFDPYDEDDVADVRHAMERERYDRMATLEAENVTLREYVAFLTGTADFELEDDPFEDTND